MLTLTKTRMPRAGANRGSGIHNESGRSVLSSITVCSGAPHFHCFPLGSISHV